jgi:hypothetical protein
VVWIVKYSRADISDHVNKHALQYDDTGKTYSVGWYGDLYIAESKEALIEKICKKAGINGVK